MKRPLNSAEWMLPNSFPLICWCPGVAITEMANYPEFRFDDGHCSSLFSEMNFRVLNFRGNRYIDINYSCLDIVDSFILLV